MAITFDSIPANVRVPFFYIEFSAAGNSLNQTNQQTLIIGQTLNAHPLVPILISSVEAAAGLFGPGSMLTQQCAYYFKNDSTGTVKVLPLADNPAGVVATSTITPSGTATAAGIISLYVAGTLVQVGVAKNDGATTIATNIAASVNANVFLPCTASANTGVVTLSANHKGAQGNYIDVRVNYRGFEAGEVLPAGVTLTISAFSGGAGDPLLTGLDSILHEENFDFLCAPYSDTGSLAALTDLLNNITGRWAYNRRSYGHYFTAHVPDGTYTDAMNALVTLGNANNDQHDTVISLYDTPTHPAAFAATYAGAAANSLRANPARPLQTLVLNGVLAPPLASRFTWRDRNTLLNNGIATAKVGAGNVVQIERAVTTYQVNSFGSPDQSYLDTETLFTIMYIARFLEGNISQKYPRSMLAANGTNVGAGAAVVTPDMIEAELIASYQTLIDQNICQDMATFKKGLVVELDASDASRVNILYDPVLMSGLRVVAVKNQFLLQSPTV